MFEVRRIESGELGEQNTDEYKNIIQDKLEERNSIMDDTLNNIQKNEIKNKTKKSFQENNN